MSTPIERCALEYIDFVGTIREAQTYVPSLANEAAVLAAVSSRFGPLPLLRRVRTLTEASPDNDDDVLDMDDMSMTDGEAPADVASAPTGPPHELTRSDVPAVWNIFASSVRALLTHKRALSTKDGSSRGWRGSTEWHLLKRMQDEARREGQRHAAVLVQAATTGVVYPTRAAGVASPMPAER